MSETNLRDIAASHFKSGFNCAESVLLTLTEILKVDCDVAPRIATGFGAGVGRCGDVCGALSGAVMMLSLKYGRENGADAEAKDRLYGMVQRLFDIFENEFGSVRCKDITGIDLRTSEGMARFKAEDLHNTLCPKFVIFAAESALSLLQE